MALSASLNFKSNFSYPPRSEFYVNIKQRPPQLAFHQPATVSTFSSVLICTKHWERDAAHSQGCERRKQVPQQEMRIWTLFSICFRVLFKALLAQSKRVERWLLGEFLPCQTNRSTLPFNSSIYQLSAHFNIMTYGWQYKQIASELPKRQPVSCHFNPNCVC